MNFSFDKNQCIYFLGICGTAMGNAALLLKSLGYSVAGADNNPYPPMSTVLEQAGIPIFLGYDAQRLAKLNPGLVVVGNALSRGNSELEWILESRTIPYLSLPELLRKWILERRKTLVIAGTHGKTTTTALAAYLLDQWGAEPGYLVGGIPLNFKVGAHLGGSNQSPFVIEGDEYDSAFFDKRSKFIHYNAHILAINNIEFDHAEIFFDLKDVLRAFRHALALVPPNGAILANGDDLNVLGICEKVFWAPTYTVGFGKQNVLRIADYNACSQGTGSSFNLYWRENLWCTVNWKLYGLHNARNCAMALLGGALLLYPEDPTRIQPKNLKNFLGVARRQETLLETENISLVEDFAHHPTAIQVTLEALKERYPNHILHACFEPRSYTSCRDIHQQSLPAAFKSANNVYLGPVFSTKSSGVHGILDTQKAARDLKQFDIQAAAFETFEALASALTDAIHLDGDKKHLVVLLTNGNFGGLRAHLKTIFSANIRATSALQELS